MRFRNSLRLLMENFKHVYRILLYQLVVSLIATALCCAFVLPEIMDIWNSNAVQGLMTNAKAFIKAFLAANATDLQALKGSIFGDGGSVEQIGDLLASMTTEIVWTCIGVALVYLLKRFVDTLCYFAVGSTLNDKMSTYAETPFSSAYVANLGKASVYAALYVPVVFLFDVLTIAVCCLILSVLPIFAALFVCMTLIVVCQSLKLTFTNLWMPAMTVDNKPLLEAVRYANKREKKQRSKIFATYLVSVYLVIIINVMAALFTFGSALLITVPASYFLFICEQYVNYYTMKGKKYFLTYEKIATNPDHGDSEHFFDYIEDAPETQTKEQEDDTKNIKE